MAGGGGAVGAAPVPGREQNGERLAEKHRAKEGDSLLTPVVKTLNLLPYLPPPHPGVIVPHTYI